MLSSEECPEPEATTEVVMGGRREEEEEEASPEVRKTSTARAGRDGKRGGGDGTGKRGKGKRRSKTCGRNGEVVHMRAVESKRQKKSDPAVAAAPPEEALGDGLGEAREETHPMPPDDGEHATNTEAPAEVSVSTRDVAAEETPSVGTPRASSHPQAEAARPLFPGDSRDMVLRDLAASDPLAEDALARLSFLQQRAMALLQQTASPSSVEIVAATRRRRVGSPRATANGRGSKRLVSSNGGVPDEKVSEKRPKSTVCERPKSTVCERCGKQCGSSLALSGHRRFCDGGRWRCDWCACRSDETNGKNPGPRGPATLCGACGSRFRAGHKGPLLANANGKFPCEACGKELDSIAALGGHRRFCDGGAWRCKWCACSANECSGKNPGPDGPATLCGACGSRYRSGRAGPPTLKDGKYECEDCGKLLDTVGALGGHRRFCDGGKWRCKWCECTAQQCTGKNPGPDGPATLCGSCGSRYRSGHSGPPKRGADGKFVCEDCGKLLDSMIALGGHRRFCPGGVNWRCEWCRRPSETRADGPGGTNKLCGPCHRDWAVLKHESPPLASADGSSVVCDSCGARFPDPQALADHRDAGRCDSALLGRLYDDGADFLGRGTRSAVLGPAARENPVVVVGGESSEETQLSPWPGRKPLLGGAPGADAAIELWDVARQLVRHLDGPLADVDVDAVLRRRGAWWRAFAPGRVAASDGFDWPAYERGIASAGATSPGFHSLNAGLVKAMLRYLKGLGNPDDGDDDDDDDAGRRRGADPPGEAKQPASSCSKKPDDGVQKREEARCASPPHKKKSRDGAKNPPRGDNPGHKARASDKLRDRPSWRSVTAQTWLFALAAAYPGEPVAMWFHEAARRVRESREAKAQVQAAAGKKQASKTAKFRDEQLSSIEAVAALRPAERLDLVADLASLVFSHPLMFDHAAEATAQLARLAASKRDAWQRRRRVAEAAEHFFIDGPPPTARVFSAENNGQKHVTVRLRLGPSVSQDKDKAEDRLAAQLEAHGKELDAQFAALRSLIPSYRRRPLGLDRRGRVYYVLGDVCDGVFVRDPLSAPAPVAEKPIVPRAGTFLDYEPLPVRRDGVWWLLDPQAVLAVRRDLCPRVEARLAAGLDAVIPSLVAPANAHLPDPLDALLASDGCETDEVCAVCGESTLAQDGSAATNVLLCDDCDAEVHFACSGLELMPGEDDPFQCRACAQIAGLTYVSRRLIDRADDLDQHGGPAADAEVEAVENQAPPSEDDVQTPLAPPDDRAAAPSGFDSKAGPPSGDSSSSS